MNLMQRCLLSVAALTLSMFVGIESAWATDFCWKNSYGRGVGTIPTACLSGKQYDAGLCYNPCNSGYRGAGPLCWQTCPAGYVDTGALCHINQALTANVGWECGYSSWGVCWWWRSTCPSGYTNAGLFCALNTPPVPAGWSGLTGLDIIKGSYGRGVGTVPTDCGAKQYDAGLCYNACNGSYSSVGPVCWGQCPTGMVACGAGCAKDQTTCAMVTGNQVFSTVMLAVNVATFGSSGGATAVANSVEEATRAAKMIADAKRSIEALKATESFKRLSDTAQGALLAKRFYDLNEAQTTEQALRVMAGFDPTGVSGVVAAYAYGKCQ
jgi:hypothetical protein